ncbi:MAG: LEA type 2 family protein [Halioglobus sp.]|nr:LEA type 2 family protein [Halioglobus sp.]
MTRRYVFYRALFAMMITMLVGCASFLSDMDSPKVTLESFRNVPVESGPPRFEIQLRVINPNQQVLDIAGISYAIELLDREVITGVANNIPPIEGYGEGVVTFEAGLQLLEILRLVTSLGDSHSGSLVYRFSAKIDFNGLMPTQRIEESGEIDLQ